MSLLTPTYLGGTSALTTEAVVGTPETVRPEVMIPGTEELANGEIRVSILGSGLPWVTKSQAAGSVLMEIGNAKRDVLVFDIGAGSLANFSGLMVPITSLKTVFLSHLHGDHLADDVTLMSSYVKMGRLDPVEVWGGDSDEPALGIEAFVDAIDRALAWDLESMRGNLPTTGAKATAHPVPYDRTEVTYERNEVTIASFPVIHALNGAVGFRVDFAGQSVVFSGDTIPTMTLVEAAQGCDLLIHEAFVPPETFAQLTGMPMDQATFIVNEGDTPANAAGLVFGMVQPRMAAMWHCHVVEGHIEEVFNSLRTTYSGPANLCQDLTVFNVTAAAVQARQIKINHAQGQIIGQSETPRTLDTPHEWPSWWADATIDWQSKLS